jgi:hypothetical protein
MKKTIITTIIAASLGLQALPASAATREEIAATVAAACAGGGDCGAAVQAAIALANTPDLAVVIGQGLADAVAMVGSTNPDLATLMLTVIAEAPSEVQTAYQIAVDVLTATTEVEPAPAAPAPATPTPPAVNNAGSPG